MRTAFAFSRAGAAMSTLVTVQKAIQAVDQIEEYIRVHDPQCFTRDLVETLFDARTFILVSSLPQSPNKRRVRRVSSRKA